MTIAELTTRTLSEAKLLPNIISKLRRDFIDIYCWGDTVWMGNFGNNANFSEPLTLGQMYRKGLATIRDLLPTTIKRNLLENTLQSLPIARSKQGIEPIGGSSSTRVYRVIMDNRMHYTIGISKESADTQNKKTIFSRVTWLQRDYYRVREMYQPSKVLIPDQQYAVFQDNYNRWRYLFVRDYVPSPIRDIFQVSIDEISAILRDNPHVKEQVNGFLTISNDNERFVLTEQLDLLGHHNLCLATINGEPNLVFLDAHTRELRNEKDNYHRQQIRARLKHLAQAVQKANS
ncbi:MAG: hypothetical protein V1487_03035 [bacterium]